MAESSIVLFERNQFQKPQVNLARSTIGRMWLVNFCAFITILQSSFSDSFSSLAVAAGAVFAAVLTEILFLYKDGKAVLLKDGSAVASALILTLLLPNQISPLYAAAGAAFAMAVIKHSFGGLGSNWLNPAAGGWLFIRFSWPSAFNRALEGSLLSPPADFNSGHFAALSQDGTILSFLNRTIFSFVGVELPGAYMNLFTSPYPGIIADRGILALLFGTIIIIAFQACRSWVPAVYLAFFCFFFRLGGDLPYGDELWKGDILFALCTGGTLVAAFLLASDPATGAKSKRGIFITALIGGILAFMIRSLGSEFFGAVYAALFINMISPLIQILENLFLYNKREKTQGSGEYS